MCGMLALASCGGGNVGAGNSGGTDVPPTGNSSGMKKNDMLYGMCYIQEERDDFVENVEVDAQLMYNMGVGCTRNWMHIRTLLDSKSQVNREACDRMHTCLQAQKERGITLIGVNHTNFNNGSAVAGKPRRDISEGSYYIKWLQDYYMSWKTLAKEFPEIEYWEIENEENVSDFMKDLEGNKVYTLDQMADIATDLFYYASRGIHAGNPKAKTVMGGLVGLAKGGIRNFLDKIYVRIKSGEYGYFYGLEKKENASTDPDDYFEVACWHPYVWDETFQADDFVENNNKIYNVIKNYEPEGKDVIFSEIGFPTDTYNDELQAQMIEEMFQTVKKHLPYVKAVTYFKLFDVAQITWTGKLSRYGLFYDPHDRQYTQVLGEDTTTLLVNGAPKPSALAFQKVAGGSGSLTLLCEKEKTV